MAYVHPAPRLDALFNALSPEEGLTALRHAYGPESLGIGDWVHWDKLRHLAPPAELSHEQWWLGIKYARYPLLRDLPLADPEGRPFRYAMPDQVLRRLHHVDQHCAGEIAMADVVTSDDQARQHYLVNSVMEEAIRSSQLEGAITTRRVALEMLRTGRPPADRSERMILNNYRALEFMRGMGPRLEPGLVLELHRILTEGTLDNPDAAGRLQLPSEERVAVVNAIDGTVVHFPPPAEQLPARLETLCAFANGETDEGTFIHPVLRAILVHFWLAYDHPFEDGNGRTARALFYWTMAKEGYWLTEYLSISRILRKAPSRYSDSYVLTETDEGDTTYFILYQLEVIERAIEELRRYLTRKVAEIRDVESRIRAAGDLNHRQLALLGHALRSPGQRYTYASHAASHGVTPETARTDLLALEELGLLERVGAGRRHRYSAPRDLEARLKTTQDEDPH